jgi:hypothetical protein
MLSVLWPPEGAGQRRRASERQRGRGSSCTCCAAQCLPAAALAALQERLVDRLHGRRQLRRAPLLRVLPSSRNRHQRTMGRCLGGLVDGKGTGSCVKLACMQANARRLLCKPSDPAPGPRHTRSRVKRVPQRLLTRPAARPGSSASSDWTVGTVLGLNSCALAGSMGTHTLPVLGCTQNGA